MQHQNLKSKDLEKQRKKAYKLKRSKRPIFIDCDMGSDDALAIMMAVNTPNIAIKGIGLARGNRRSVATLAINLERIFTAAQVEVKDIPVYIGKEETISVRDRIPRVDRGFGLDALGDVPDSEPEALPASQASDLFERYADNQTYISAGTAIDMLSKTFRKRLEIISLGPLTNIAEALQIDPDLPNRIARLTIMGGDFNTFTPALQLDYNFLENSYPSFDRPIGCEEFNFRFDPMAAINVIDSFTQSLGHNLQMYNWKTCDKHRNFGKELTKQELRSIWNSNYEELYSAITDPFFDLKSSFWYDKIEPGSNPNGKRVKSYYGASCDTEAMAIALNPRIVTNVQFFNKGIHCMVDGGNIGHNSQWGGHSLSVINAINATKYAKMVATAFLVTGNEFGGMHSVNGSLEGQASVAAILVVLFCIVFFWAGDSYWKTKFS